MVRAYLSYVRQEERPKQPGLRADPTYRLDCEWDHRRCVFSPFQIVAESIPLDGEVIEGRRDGDESGEPEPAGEAEHWWKQARCEEGIAMLPPNGWMRCSKH